MTWTVDAALLGTLLAGVGGLAICVALFSAAVALTEPDGSPLIHGFSMVSRRAAIVGLLLLIAGLVLRAMATRASGA